MASLLNDAASISDHKENENKISSSVSYFTAPVESHAKSTIEHTTHSDQTAASLAPSVSENADNKKLDLIDLSSIKDSIKADADFAPIFTMYHGKIVELGKVPETAFKKNHAAQPVENVKTPEYDSKVVATSKRVLDEESTTKPVQHKTVDVTPTKREFHSVKETPVELKLDHLPEEQHDVNGVTKDTISMPSIDSSTSAKGDLINHVKGVVLDDGKIISVGNNHVLDNLEQPKAQADLLPDVQQKFMVAKDGNVEPLTKQRSETADAVQRDNLENGQKTVTLTVDVLKQLLKKTDSKVSLAQLLNKPSESSSDQRSNTQEDEDPGMSYHFLFL